MPTVYDPETGQEVEMSPAGAMSPASVRSNDPLIYEEPEPQQPGCWDRFCNRMKKWEISSMRWGAVSAFLSSIIVGVGEAVEDETTQDIGRLGFVAPNALRLVMSAARWEKASWEFYSSAIFLIAFGLDAAVGFIAEEGSKEQNALLVAGFGAAFPASLLWIGSALRKQDERTNYVTMPAKILGAGGTLLLLADNVLEPENNISQVLNITARTAFTAGALGWFVESFRLEKKQNKERQQWANVVASSPGSTMEMAKG